MWSVCILQLLLLLPAFVHPRRRYSSSINAITGSAEGAHRNSASECRFGGESYELEQTWHPDLGPPFGVMFCVHCECVPIHKKRRIVGRVRCKNIKSDCPKPNCPEPILLPGRCCKVCPGQDNNPDNNIVVDLEREEQEKNGRHYASILSGDGVEGGAIGRLYFRKKTLQWSLVWSDNLSPPLHLSFLDKQENILDEFTTPITELYNRTGKLCGTWPRLPRKYRRILRSEEMQVSVVFPEGTVAGSIDKHYGLTSELLSGILIGSTGLGTAVISIDVGTGSVHANLLFRGLVEAGQSGVPFTIQFVRLDGGDLVLDENVVLDSAASPGSGNGVNSIELRTVLDPAEIEALGRAEIQVRLHPAGRPGDLLTGTIIPRISCDMMDCVLSSRGQDREISGLAFMSFNKQGNLVYKIRIEETNPEVKMISLDNGKKSRRLFNIIPNIQADFNNGVAQGEMRLTSGQVEELLKEDFYFTIMLRDVALRGRVLVQLAGPSHLAGEPVLLSGNSTVSGLSWVSLDNNCRLYYALRVEGADLDSTEAVLDLEDYPLENLKALPLFPSHRRQLQVCQGRRCSGHADSLHKLTISRLHSGDAALLLSYPDVNLKGMLDNVDTPLSCLPKHNRNSLERVPGYLNDLGEKVPETLLQKCYYEGAFYDDGQQWDASHTQCQMCSCQRGKVVCDVMICPPTNCTDPIIPEGECCATCSIHHNSGRGCSLGGNNRIHPEGSKWHPYIPPFGFSRCAVCTCKSENLTVECYKESCPRLDCPHTEQIRPGPLSCCKECKLPDPKDETEELDLVPVDTDKLNDMGMVRTGLDILASGGCKWKGQYHENGDSWHPTVLPWGEMNCVNCSCKDGEASCIKRRCPVLSCKLQIRDDSQCCPRCAANRAEQLRAAQRLAASHRRRQRRLRRLRHRNGQLHR